MARLTAVNNGGVRFSLTSNAVSANGNRFTVVIGPNAEERLRICRDPLEVERSFVEELDVRDEVVVYSKLPRGFFIPTPFGDYTPTRRSRSAMTTQM